MKQVELNSIQYKFWMDNQLKYPSPEYNNPNFTFIVEGNLSIALLQKSYKSIMLEYPPFCSVIKVQENQPYFVYDENFADVPFTTVEYLSSLEEVEKYIVSVINTPFDLQKEFPCRFYAIHFDNKWYLVHLFNHVVMDGMDLPFFFDRLSVVYDQLVSDSYQFVGQLDAMLAYNRSFEKTYQENNEKDVKYWKEFIKDFPLQLPVPTAPNEVNLPVSYFFKGGEDLQKKAESFCTENHTTLFRLYAAVWALSLARTVGVDKLLLDHTLNSRPKGDKTLLGVFVNNLPLKFDFENGDLSVADILQEVDKNRQQERQHQYAVYYDILHEAGKSLANSGAINISVSYPSRFKKMKLALEGCQVIPYGHIDVQLSADLAMVIEDDPELTCDIRHQPHTPIDFLHSLSSVFVEILKQVISNPFIKVKELRLISQKEERKLLTREDKALHRAVAPASFLSNFKGIVDRFSSNVAAEFKGQSLTYQELDRLSDNVAEFLMNKGFYHSRIGLSTPKNLQLLIGILGILKSGNTYVPIDYQFPSERIRFMIQDCELVAMLVTKDTPVDFNIQSYLIENLSAYESNKSFCVPEVQANDEAYVIYTSGTTGKPKGIPILHSSLNQTILNHLELLRIDSGYRVSQFANICFDASIFEIFPIINIGGTIVFPEEEERQDPSLFLDFIESRKINMAYIPPVFLANSPKKDLPCLSIIMTGGESTSREVIDFWSKNRKFINLYGPTENTVDISYALMNPSSFVNDIGNPVSGVTCYVLDNYLQLMPTNTVGELYVGGVKLTNGYINRPELNKEKFIENPFVSEEDRKSEINLFLYKTGDLVSRHSDGHLIFWGRSDFQVKLNGYRIELGDIESQILAYNTAVKNAIALISGSSDNKKLVAYIQSDEPENFDVVSLKKNLAEALPAYMIPSKFIILKDFPYNSSGKVDRKQLPDPSLFQEEKREVVAPETSTEKALANLWTKFLSIDQIGRDDDFLALGGDSMGVIQLSFGIEESFDIIVRASDIYKHTTLRSLAEFIDSQFISKDLKAESEDDSLYKGKLPLSPVQMALWLQCAQSESIKNSYNLPCIFRCPDNMRFEKLEEAFNHLVRLQDSFRMTFPLDKEGRPFIHISEYSSVSVERIYIKSEELKQVFRQGMKASFDLEHGPLFHCVLYLVEGGACYCSIIMHHLISDGWSANQIKTVLLNSLMGKDVKWENFSETYTNYVNDVNRFMRTKAYSHRLDYWKDQLKDVSDLKIMKPKRGQENDPSGSCYVCPFPEGLQDEVNAFCYNQIYTPFGFYVSIYLLLLAKISKQSNFGVGFPFLGRERGNYSHVMGYFVHTLPILYKEEYNDYSFLKYIAAIHQELIDTRENSVSLDELVKIARRESGDPTLALVQTMFSYEDKELFHDLISHEQSSFGLSLIVLNEESNCSCCIEYQHSCFSEEEAKVLVEAFFSLLKSVMANGELPLKKHSLASEAYCKEVIESNVCWTSVNRQSILPFIDKFYKVVKETPEQVAIRYKDEFISYRELDRLSAEVAQNIREANIVTPASIAVNMDASIDAVVTILGVLKSGCCYIPIAEDLPEERREFILNDASCSMLFNKENFPHGKCLDVDKETAFDFTDCAYVIYTSGTTGQPKGVPIRQEALAHLVDVEGTRFGLSAASRVLLFSSISFDASVTELFTTMAVGATLVIAAPEQRKDVQQLTNLLLQESVTCATIPPALLPLLPRVEYPDLATLIVGGESASPSILKQWVKGRRVINAYGPTENTVDTTLCVVDEDFEPDDIGLPLPGVTCYVLDEELNIVPAGMEGELYIGGVQLTKGYLNRPNLNQEQFIDNPFVLAEDEDRGLNMKLYRSGDVVIRRPNGHLIFRGRKDRQVKFHGFRIELSEIEKHLLLCESVQQVLVEIRKEQGKEVLVAFVQSDQSIEPADLQRILRQKLPIYMVPTKWAVIAEFPLTVNGKIDKKSLPVPILAVQQEIVLPAIYDEEILLNLVRDFLGTDAIGVETDLLDLGMTSMQIMEFVMYASEHSSFHITISAIYENRTVRKLVKDCERKLYFWLDQYDDHKPLLVLICGIPYLHPFYDNFIAYFKDKFNIFVLESFNEYFHKKEQVSLDILLDHYMEVTDLELKGKKIDVVSGFCVGSEIGMQYASRLKKSGIACPKVLMLEGFFNRSVSEDLISQVVVNKVALEEFVVSTKLFKTYFPIDFDGDIIICLSGKMGNKITPGGEEEITEELFQVLNREMKENEANWKQAYPNAPYYLLDADHWTFFEKQNLEVLWNAMKTHWGI